MIVIKTNHNKRLRPFTKNAYLCIKNREYIKEERNWT